MNTLIRLLLLTILFVGIITFWEQIRDTRFFSRFRRGDNQTQNMVLKEITKMGKLELVKFKFKDIVEHEQVNTFLPNANAILIVEGEATGCIDLTQIKEDNVSIKGDSITVLLPRPELCTWKINHDRSWVYDTRFSFLDESQLVSNAYRQAERQVRQSALSNGILAQTQQNARQLLIPLLERVSGKKAGLTFPEWGK